MSDRLKLFFALLVASIIGGAVWGQWPKSQVRQLTFLAVGQGDCTVWQDGDVTVLIDAGPKTREGFDGGERIVLPKLREMRIKRVAAIIITHPDSDHIGGLGAVANRYKEAKVVASDAFRHDPDMVWWLKEAGIGEERMVWIGSRTRLSLDRSSIELAPPVRLEGASNNDGSLFVRIVYGPATAVVTGDASTEVEQSMQTKLKWTAQVLKVGHHGSRTSTSEAFVRALGPEWAAISCGKENRFGHPHPSVLQVLERQRVKVFRTDTQGDISFGVWANGFAPLAAHSAAK